MGGLGDGGDFGGGGIPEHLAFRGAKKSLKRNRRQSIFPSAVLRIVTCSASYWSATPLVTNSSRARRLPLRGMKQARPA